MIETYSDYIRNYIRHTGGPHIPGEHHFVAVYLVPRLQSLPELGVPDFVNPDGMKAIPGDIVYYDQGTAVGEWRMRLGIEVKLGSLTFSRTEYNEWMTTDAIHNQRPHLFIGIGDRTYKLGSGITSGYGRYVKSRGDPVTGRPASNNRTLRSPRNRRLEPRPRCGLRHWGLAIRRFNFLFVSPARSKSARPIRSGRAFASPRGSQCRSESARSCRRGSARSRRIRQPA